MSDKIAILYYVLWITHPILQTAIAVAMFRYGRHRQFKYFFAYIVAQILTFAVVFPTYRYNIAACAYLSWLSTAISVALGFEVIHEAFLDAFRPFHTLRDLGTVLFKWAGLVMLLVAGVVSVSTNSSDTVPWVQAILTAQRCVRIVQVGMVLFLLFFARYLGVRWRQYSFGVALGFGCFAMVELSLVASWVGDHLNNLSIGLVNMAAYNCTLLIWLGYTLAKSPAREAPANLLRPQRWEQSLTDIHHPLPADSLIPMFEGMVDRALSRTQASPSMPQENSAPSKAAAAQAGAASGSGSGLFRAFGTRRVEEVK
ncbi:MAG: hypothetical protein WCD48_19915 [Candidatus Sulfotelmatobacter sp.]|jgi:hypothetical protein